MSKGSKLKEAGNILVDLGLPRAQQNERTALCLLALLNLTPKQNWSNAESPMMGITPIMDWSRRHYGKNYAPNTRETIRRQSMHQFVQAGICLYNPDEPGRPVNSPYTVYQISPELLRTLKTYGTSIYKISLAEYLDLRPTLAAIYAKSREMAMVPLQINAGQRVMLSAGSHSTLIKQIIEDFAPRFVADGRLVYIGDTGDKYGYFDAEFLKKLSLNLDHHGKLPDVVVYSEKNNWLFLIESVTSHGPVDSKRHTELKALFHGCTAGLVYVSALPDRKGFLKYMDVVGWETEVWIASAPTHMIHFNGQKFLGPYSH